MFRAVNVSAVSTPRQAGPERFSLDDQLSSNRRAAEHIGPVSIIEEIMLPGQSRNYISLADLCHDSPPYARLVELVTTRAVNLVICTDTDRLWRRAALQAQFSALCELSGVQIYAVASPQELVPPEDYTAGRSDSALILEAVSGIVSEIENRKRTRRRMAGMRARVERHGLYFSGTPPYGYTRTGNPDAPLMPDPLEAPWVETIYTLRAQGYGLWPIIDALRERHTPTRSGGPWSSRALWGILHNPVYAGGARWREWSLPGVATRRVKETVINWDGKHPTLISRETWEEAQRINTALGERARVRVASAYPLARLVMCGYGDPPHPMSWKERGRYLNCGRYLSSGGRECRSNQHPRWRVEAFVLSEVRRALTDPQVYETMLRERFASEDGGTEAESLAARLGDLDARQRRLLDALEAGRFPMEELLRRQEALDHERERIEDRLEYLEHTVRRLSAAHDRIFQAAELLDELDHLDPPALNALLRTLIEAVVITREGTHIQWLL